jgi:peptide deformylase
MNTVVEPANLQVITIPHPALRHVSKPLRRVDKALGQMVASMFELMYEHRGVGLAANQVNLPFQLFIVNETGERDAGEELVFLNPVLQLPGGRDEDDEGCLSIPGVYGPVIRPARIQVLAWDLSGNKIDRVVEGRLARIIQHEYDHLQGVLFPDRMSEGAQRAIAPELEAFEQEYLSQLRRDESLGPASVARHLAALESEYCQTG